MSQCFLLKMDGLVIGVDRFCRQPFALTTITLSPLKRLEVTQENGFNSKYGINTAVINEDHTPRDDTWWDHWDVPVTLGEG
jgi:hypothetical protein